MLKFAIYTVVLLALAFVGACLYFKAVIANAAGDDEKAEVDPTRMDYLVLTVILFVGIMCSLWGASAFHYVSTTIVSALITIAAIWVSTKGAPLPGVATTLLISQLVADLAVYQEGEGALKLFIIFAVVKVALALIIIFLGAIIDFLQQKAINQDTLDHQTHNDENDNEEQRKKLKKEDVISLIVAIVLVIVAILLAVFVVRPLFV